eukprot:CAMPEP_0173387536 /NCGR_PEP_ID=MMETSP1356-20130122/10029_1 /TAXON_ID=77927 ORGANISM="Hemiselmis virescens, Strain PCC157" /NCGR_SAMPLE_ID=MMETSP1356 /ASSEMBLY_ACC=CAM_ASM_000847 /LENGTH=162 /DNA_ID=CAMNT_0014344185 /DNA_START=234 /DNA_END=719 /DNA_ORIENTATION=-
MVTAEPPPKGHLELQAPLPLRPLRPRLSCYNQVTTTPDARRRSVPPQQPGEQKKTLKTPGQRRKKVESSTSPHHVMPKAKKMKPSQQISTYIQAPIPPRERVTDTQCGQSSQGRRKAGVRPQMVISGRGKTHPCVTPQALPPPQERGGEAQHSKHTRGKNST